MKKIMEKSSFVVLLLTVVVLSLPGCSSKNNTKEPATTQSVTKTPDATKTPVATKAPEASQPAVTAPAATNPSVMKSITVEVVDNKGKSKTYNIKSDAKFLFDALKATEGLTLEGAVGDYGYYMTAVNGITADYDKDQAYWAFYVNGEYGQTSVDTQPIADGDTFKLAYEKAKSE